MKTKEEIDGQAKIDGERIYPGMTANQQKQRDAFINGFCYGAEYSDQQNKEKDAEIQRLTKEVELLKLESDIAFKKVNDKKAENTRLRELLVRAKFYLEELNRDNYPDAPEFDNPPLKALISEINALNHKP